MDDRFVEDGTKWIKVSPIPPHEPMPPHEPCSKDQLKESDDAETVQPEDN